MEQALVMTVERVLFLERADLLVLFPNFSVPEEFPAKCEEKVRLERPDGSVIEAMAEFCLGHVNIRGSVDLDQRWRITAMLYGMTEKDVPAGTKVFCSAEFAKKLLPAEK